MSRPTTTAHVLPGAAIGDIVLAVTTRGVTRGLLLSAAIAMAVATAWRAAAAPSAARDWPAYGGGPEGIRYSPLAQITRANVTRLAVAWTYDTGEDGGLQTNPIVVGRTLYTTTPHHRTIALDAATGAVRWSFDAGLNTRGANRGVTYWTDGRAARIFTAVDRFVYALDAATGRPIASFGRAGRIDLHEGLGRPPESQSVRLTTPGTIYRDLLIVGGRVSEGLPASPGDIRAIDVRTGAVRWTFRTIPAAGEPGAETWPAGARETSGGANNWAGVSVDTARGIVFVPTGSAAADFYGANRPGDNLYANTLLALDAATGKRLWHYQTVRHDIWDRDLPAPPALVTVTRGGRRVDAVAQTSKQGILWLFERTTGRPLFPIVERPFPASTVPGEQASRTQPQPLLPAPFTRQRLTEDMLTRRTPAAHADVLARFRRFRSDGQFVPLGVDVETIVFPGFDGGAGWGGPAFDPASGLLYVNANELPCTGLLAPAATGSDARQLYVRECAACHRDDLTGAPPQIPSLVDVGRRKSPADLIRIVRRGVGRMPGQPALAADVVEAIVGFIGSGENRDVAHAGATGTSQSYRFTGYTRFLDPDGYPSIAPPWGTLTAIDLNTGAHAWQVPLGEYPELAAQGMATTGTESYGGPIVTGGGLVFIGATSYDKKVRAFDKATGALLWEATLPFSAVGTPATYEVDGRQFLVVPAGGGKARRPEPSGGVYVAFALPAGS
jgi:quinoprotein glucose dehydrogenase